MAPRLLAAALLLLPAAGERILPRRPRRATLAGALALAAGAAGERIAHLRFDGMDANGDGFVDEGEILAAAEAFSDAVGADEAYRRKMRGFASSLYGWCDVDLVEGLNERELEYAKYWASHAALHAQTAGEYIADFRFPSSALPQLRELDANGDGKLDEEEFWAAGRRDLVWFGLPASRFDETEVHQRMHALFRGACSEWDWSVDDEPHIYHEEGLRYANFLVYEYAIEAQAQDFLEMCDENGDGKVELSEVERGAEEAAGQPGRKASVMRIVRDGFAAAELNGDGALDAQEMRVLVAKSVRLADPEREP